VGGVFLKEKKKAVSSLSSRRVERKKGETFLYRQLCRPGREKGAPYSRREKRREDDRPPKIRVRSLVRRRGF